MSLGISHSGRKKAGGNAYGRSIATGLKLAQLICKVGDENAAIELFTSNQLA